MVIGRRQFNLASLQQSQNFQYLDQRVQNLISSLSLGSRSFEEIKDAVLKENEKTRDHISSQLRDQEKRLAEEEYRTRLLESLWFADILSREETIAEAHRETFEWIFDKSGKAIRPWDNFNTRLEAGGGTYWISGKAGSGKSTLMGFICQDERTREALMTWSGTRDLLMPKFFFWSSGSKSQRSLEGLLRSLLWQILSEFSDLTLPLFDGGPHSEQHRRASKRNNLIGAWTKPRLQRALNDIMKQLEATCCLCFFIDGLDEFDEDDDELIEFVQNLVTSNRIKVCSSSRPNKSFADAFGYSTKLRLQDLTQEDIQRFVTDRFQEVPQLKSLMRDHKTEMNELKNEIVEKADGVFLWVSLAVKDQIRGLRNGDGPEMLQQRLALLPPEIEGVYLRMLHQIDRSYKQEACHFLRMALHKPRVSLLGHALVAYKGLEDMLLSSTKMLERDIELLCQAVQKRITITCVGLLEDHQPMYLDVESGDSFDLDAERDPPSESCVGSKYSRNSSSERDFEQLRSGTNDDTSASDFDRETTYISEGVHHDGSPYSHLSNAASVGSTPTTNSESENPDARSFSFSIHASVNFVHRTAVEFLENSVSGKGFLLGNSSPNFDPQIVYAKVLLGTLKVNVILSNYIGEDESEHVDHIMSTVASIEDSANVAQTNLCELIDRTMSVIDRQHPDWRANTHWCTRWGRLSYLYRENESPSTASSSRSSSYDSFYSTESKFIDRGGSRAAEMELSSFLGFSASHGLSRYVQQMLNREPRTTSQETLDFLLFCSVAVHPNDFQWLNLGCKSLNIAPELLRQGANPNAIFLGKTIWIHFLERSLWVWTAHIVSDFNLTLGANAIITCVMAFIDKAVDVESIWIFHFWSPTVAFDIQLSALSLIGLLMQYEPGFSRFQEIEINMGAVYHSRVTMLEVKGIIQHPEMLKRHHELSEQESRDFMEVFEQNLLLTKSQARPVGEGFYAEVIELSDRFDNNRSEASKLSPIGTEYLLTDWGGSEWGTYFLRFSPGAWGIAHSDWN